MLRPQLFRLTQSATAAASAVNAGTARIGFNLQGLPAVIDGWIPHVLRMRLVATGTVRVDAAAGPHYSSNWVGAYSQIDLISLGRHPIQISSSGAHKVMASFADRADAGAALGVWGPDLPVNSGQSAIDYEVEVECPIDFTASRITGGNFFVRPTRAYLDGTVSYTAAPANTYLPPGVRWTGEVSYSLEFDLGLSNDVIVCPDFEWRDYQYQWTGSFPIEPATYFSIQLSVPRAANSASYTRACGVQLNANVANQESLPVVTSNDYPWRFPSVPSAAYRRTAGDRGALSIFSGLDSVQFGGTATQAAYAVSLVGPSFTGEFERAGDSWLVSNKTFYFQLTQNGLSSGTVGPLFSVARRPAGQAAVTPTGPCSPIISGVDGMMANIQSDVGTACGKFGKLQPYLPSGGIHPGPYVAAMLPHIARRG